MSRPGVDWPPPLSVKRLAEVDPGLALQESAYGGRGAPGERGAVSLSSVLVGTLVRRSRVRPAFLLPSWESVPGCLSSSGFPLMNRFATSPCGGGQSDFRCPRGFPHPAGAGNGKELGFLKLAAGREAARALLPSFSV